MGFELSDDIDQNETTDHQFSWFIPVGLAFMVLLLIGEILYFSWIIISKINGDSFATIYSEASTIFGILTVGSSLGFLGLYGKFNHKTSLYLYMTT